MGVEATSMRSAVRLDGDRVVGIVEKPAPGSSPSGLVAVPLYWLPREIAPSLDAAIPAEGEGYLSVALSKFAAQGGDVRACRLSGRVEVTSRRRRCRCCVAVFDEPDHRLVGLSART